MRNSEVLNYKDRLTQPLVDINQRESNIPSSNNDLKKEIDFISRETLTNVYGDNYEKTQINMKNTEQKTINYFYNLLIELNNKYNDFNININYYFKGVTNKIANTFKLNNLTEDTINVQRNSLIKKYSNEYLELLNKIIDMHEKLLENIKDSISIFFKFLDITKFLDKEKPIQEFIGKEFKHIINNWLFLKLDLEKFNFAKAINETELDPDFKNFIFKINKDKNYVMGISSPKNYMQESRKNFDNLDSDIQNDINKIMEDNKTIMIDNHNNLVKLRMNNVFSADKYFDKDINYEKMQYLKLDNISFEKEGNSNIEFLKNIPNLKKLIINSSNNFEIGILKNLSNSLTKLYLTKNGFVDFEFNNIMTNYLVKSNSIRKNLQILSFDHNNLKSVDLSQIVYQAKQSFYSLKELSFEKNKLYRFSISPEFFVELKCINCCNNCFSNSNFDQYTNILTLLSGNIYLTKENLATKYFTSLKEKLSNSFYSLSYLNLSYIPKILKNNYFSNLVINDAILINLKRLDLSHNNIKCNVLLEFLENNKGCLSLKSLNLS